MYRSALRFVPEQVCQSNDTNFANGAVSEHTGSCSKSGIERDCRGPDGSGIYSAEDQLEIGFEAGDILVRGFPPHHWQ